MKDGCSPQRTLNPVISPIARFPSSGWRPNGWQVSRSGRPVLCSSSFLNLSTDAMEGIGNVMAVMDAMGHQSVNTTRIYNHSNVTLIREAIERRNQQLSETVQ